MVRPSKDLSYPVKALETFISAGTALSSSHLSWQNYNFSSRISRDGVHAWYGGIFLLQWGGCAELLPNTTRIIGELDIRWDTEYFPRDCRVKLKVEFGGTVEP